MKLQLDMLQEENEDIINKVCSLNSKKNKKKLIYLFFIFFAYAVCDITLMLENALQLRLAEQRREQAEARARELEKQVNCFSQ